MPENIKNVMAAIDYIESHLHEKLDLETVAGAVHYSKYHLHRMFTGTVGLTIHDYVQRRQLTEAAKLLVLSDRPILEIALSAGYKNRQSFTDLFKAMYKKSPNKYREEKEFYPLQLRYVLHENPVNLEEKEWQDIENTWLNGGQGWQNGSRASPYSWCAGCVAMRSLGNAVWGSRCFRGNAKNFINESIKLISAKARGKITFNVPVSVNLAFMSDINCMETLPGYNRAKRMFRQLKL